MKTNCSDALLCQVFYLIQVAFYEIAGYILHTQCIKSSWSSKGGKKALSFLSFSKNR